MPYLAAALTIALVAAATFLLDRTEHARLRQKARAAVLQQLSTVRARLEGGVTSRLLLGRGLVSYVSSHPDIDDKQFRELARVLIARQDGIRAIQLVRGTTIRHIYPFEGNESALGIDLMMRKEQKNAIERAIASRHITVAGPITLLQGGNAFISREPIFLTPPGAPPESGPYWGLGQIVIDRDFLFTEAGLRNDESGNLLFAARGDDGLGAEGEVFWGEPSIFQRFPVTLDVLLPNGSWQIAALPRDGWLSSNTHWIKIGGALLALISGLLVWFLVRSPLRLQALVESATARLRASERQFRDISATIPVAVFISRRSDGKILYANDNFDTLFGLAPGTGVGHKTEEFYADREKLLQTVASQGMLKDYEQAARKADGTLFWCSVSLRPIVFNDIPAFLVALLDITARKQAEEHVRTLNQELELRVQERTEALAGSNRLLAAEIEERQHQEEKLHIYQAAVAAAADSIVITDRNARIEYANPAFTRTTGYEFDEVLGKTPALLKSGLHDTDFYQNLWRTLLNGREWKGEIVNRRKNGETYYEEMAIAPVTDTAGKIIRFVAVKRDITVRKLLEQRLDHMAHYDELTGLPNRSLFFDRLAHTLAQAKRNGNLFALLFIDLDGFKNINDTLGHEAGDNLLREVAKRLEQCVRESDTVARMGGDEFTIILSAIAQAEDAGQVAEKVIAALAAPIFPGTLHCEIGASIGISLYPADGIDRETLLTHADSAMYRIKEQGKNAYCYYSPHASTELG